MTATRAAETDERIREMAERPVAALDGSQKLRLKAALGASTRELERHWAEMEMQRPYPWLPSAETQRKFATAIDECERRMRETKRERKNDR